MKKSTNKTSQHRKLVLRREAIAVLTAPQLRTIAGGDDEIPCTYFSSCHCQLSGDVQCVA